MAGDLKLSLGCPQVEGAVLTLAEDDLDKVMELKQILKGAGIVTDTFESSLEWKNFKLEVTVLSLSLSRIIRRWRC